MMIDSILTFALRQETSKKFLTQLLAIHAPFRVVKISANDGKFVYSLGH
jgi:hypothetical protein